MRFSSRPWLLLALLLATAIPARADGDTDTGTEIRECLARLRSPDEPVRRTAAKRIVDIGWKAVEGVARSGESLDAAAWKAFADACEGHDLYAVPLVAAAHAAPEVYRRRLLELAHHLDPEAGIPRTPEQVADIVRSVLVDGAEERCQTGHDTAIAILGHDAVAPVLTHLRDPKRGHLSSWAAFGALSMIAEKEDVPALRALLLSGKTGVAEALGSLQRRGVPEASDALLDAVAAGTLDGPVTEALAGAPDRDRVSKVIRSWIASRPDPSIDQRCEAARLLGTLNAREDVPILEAWLKDARKPWEYAAYGTALARLGSRKGVEVLVHIVAEARGPCCGPKDAPASADRMCPDGFGDWERWPAARFLGDIAGPGVFAVPSKEEWRASRKREREAGREPESDGDLLDRAATAFHAWWSTSKDRLAFDAATGRWSVGR